MAEEIKNLKKAAQRISKAALSGGKIIVYGDADMDGVSSVVILKEAVEELGGKVSFVYFPDREKEGYGLNHSALDFLAEEAPALLLVLDCGIGNIEEIARANEMGFEVLVIDHHEDLGELPPASIIVDPKQKSDPFPFKGFACAGIIYKLAKILLEKEGKWSCPEKYLELAALATLADQMPLEDENESMVEEGLKALEYTERTGLKALAKMTQFQNTDLQELQQKILAPLNAGHSCDHSNQIYILLTEESFEEAGKMASVLKEQLEAKRQRIAEICLEAEQKMRSSSSNIVFEGDQDWPLLFLGPVASKICRKYGIPVFLYRKGKEKSQGAVRNSSDTDGVEAMASCKEILETYGGHAQASGFRIKNENLDLFKTCLEKYFGND